MSAAPRHHKEQPKWPFWVILTSGVILAVVLLYLGTRYDSHGVRLLDGPMASVIAVLGTLVVAFGQRTVGSIQHQVHNNSGGSLKDAADRTDERTEDMKRTLDKVLQRQNTILIEQAKLSSVPKEVSGLRKDIGRLYDADSQLRDALADHTSKAEAHIKGQSERIEDLEDTLDLRKKGKNNEVQ